MDNLLFKKNNIVSRSINAENRKGEKGRGGMASSVLGPSRKGSPCLLNIAPGSVTELCDITGPGMIRHIWITLDDRTDDIRIRIPADAVPVIITLSPVSEYLYAA